MTKPKLNTKLIGALGFVLVVILLWLGSSRIPHHAGRSVDAWFEDLCTGVYGGTPRASGAAASYAAFAQMDSNAVPYLIKQLHHDRSGVRQKLVHVLRRHTMTKRITVNIIWPTQRRSYAAVALRQMGPKAEAAIPALLETWAHDTSDVKVSAVAALESILRGRCTDGAPQAEWQKLESDVITEAARRYPGVAKELGIDRKHQ